MNKINFFPKKIKLILIIIPLIFLFILVNCVQYTYAISSDLKDNLFRLHIIANSNSIEDQELKYKVRDNIIKYMNTLYSPNDSKEKIIQIANEHLEDFKKIAEDTIKTNGFSYPVSVEISNVYFPTKKYGDVSLPEGYYDSLRVKIGESSGQNWWCVMFPPLCFVDVTNGIVPEESKKIMQDNLTDEEYNLICLGNNYENSENSIKLKFKIVELLNKTNLIIANN